MSPLLQVKDLKRHYEVHVPSGLFGRKASLKAVDGVSFSIEKGRRLASSVNPVAASQPRPSWCWA
jgi:peptide/nickel transport system ATP-binding protein